MKRIGDIMNRSIVTIDGSARVGQAIELMSEHELHHLPIVEAGVLAGIVTDRELSSCRPPLDDEEANLAYAITLLDRPVHEFMRPQVIAVDIDAEIEVAIDALLQDIVDIVCVVGPGRQLVGLISSADLLLAFRLERAALAEAGVLPDEGGAGPRWPPRPPPGSEIAGVP